MVITAEIEINAPLSVVWRTFSQMENWDDWNTACRSCCIVSGDEALSAGPALPSLFVHWFSH